MLAGLRRHLWLVLLCGCLISLVTFGVRASFGLFTDPLSEARGWDIEVFALAIALQNLLWGIGQPFAGGVADRFGALPVLVGGAVLYAGGTALMAVSTSPVALQLSGGVLIGLGLSGASFTIVIAAFSRLVPEDRRSWAIGLATAMGSLGQFVFAPLGQAFISAYGWATALVLLSGFIALVPALALALGGRGEVAADGEPDLPTRDALRQAFGYSSYLLLAAGFFVCGFHVAFITVYLPSYIVDLGLSANLGALAIGLVGLFNIVGSYARRRARRAPQPAASAERHLHAARGGDHPVPDRAGERGDRARLRRRNGRALALDGPAHVRARSSLLRHPPYGHAVRFCLPLASGGRVRGGVAGRRDRERHRLATTRCGG